MSGIHHELLGLGSGAGSGYTIDNSLRFDGSDDYLSRTFAAGSNTQFLLSTWIKIPQAGTYWGVLICGGDGTQTNSTNDVIYIDTAGKIGAFAKGGVTGAGGWGRSWTPNYRDPSAWYHILLISDLGNGTSADKLRLYVNGSRVTGYTDTGTVGSSWPYLNVTTTANGHVIGRINQGGGPAYAQQYLADYYFIDGGTASDASSFGETNADGVWTPIAYTGSYGTNGFHLDFADGTSTTTLGYDAAGSNDWTLNGMTRAAGTSECWMTDTPTNNFATLNPIDGSGGGGTITNGALTADPAYSTSGVPRGSIWVSSGKWYWEVTIGGTGVLPGVARSDGIRSYYSGYTGDTGGVSYNQSNGQKYINGSGSAYGASFTTNDVIGVALNMDTGAVYFSKNGQWADGAGNSNQVWASAVAAQTGMVGLYTASCGDGASNTSTVSFNFGQGNVASAVYDSASGGYFKYTPPSGFKALSTANLPTVSIQNPREHFDVKTWAGNDVSPRSPVTGLAFQPDLVWLKNRTAAASNVIYDAVRGSGSSKSLTSDTTNAEGTNASLYGYLSAFNSDGFQVTNGSDPSFPDLWTNDGSKNYVSWLWKANGAGSTNTQPANGASITSVYSANQTAGFSIVSYTGDGAASGTIYHGLNALPKMIVVKNRDVADSGVVYHAGTDTTLAKDYFLRLFAGAAGTDARSNTGAMWNDTAPTTAVFSVGTEDDVNALNEKYIAYCFAEIPGFSKFGSFIGNSSDDGPFVYCGFRPRWIMLKKATGTTYDWNIHDTARTPYNVDQTNLWANSPSAENGIGSAADWRIDVLANGFKIRVFSNYWNTSGETTIFAAFAEYPFGGSNVAPSPAR